MENETNYSELSLNRTLKRLHNRADKWTSPDSSFKRESFTTTDKMKN